MNKSKKIKNITSELTSGMIRGRQDLRTLSSFKIVTLAPVA